MMLLIFIPTFHPIICELSSLQACDFAMIITAYKMVIIITTIIIRRLN